MLRLGHDPWTLVHAAELDLDAGQVTEARATAERAVTVAPELPEAWRVAGLAALAAGDPAAALDRLGHAGSLDGVAAARIEAGLAAHDPVALGTLDAWRPATPSEAVARARLLGLAGRSAEALDAALALAADPAVGEEALSVAADQVRATCATAPLEAWIALHPGLAATLGARDALDRAKAGCGADTVRE